MKLVASTLLLLVIGAKPVAAGLCEEQLTIPWRKAAVNRLLPLNQLIEVMPDGTLGTGSPNAVIDRPFHSTWFGGGWILFTKDRMETFIQTDNEGVLRQCEFVPFEGISINGKVAAVGRILHGKPYMNQTRLTQEAIQLIRESTSGPMEVLTVIGTRFPIGEKTRMALKALYASE